MRKYILIRFRSMNGFVVLIYKHYFYKAESIYIFCTEYEINPAWHQQP